MTKTSESEIDYSWKLSPLSWIDGSCNALATIRGCTYRVMFNRPMREEDIKSAEDTIFETTKFINRCYEGSNNNPSRVSVARFKDGKLVILAVD